MKQLFLVLVLLMSCFSSFARGEIYGKITDENGHEFPEAVIKILQGGILKAGSISDDSGHYSVKPLQAGFYDAEYSSAGYATVKIKGIKVSLNGAVKQNVNLKPAGERNLAAVTIQAKPIQIKKEFAITETLIQKSATQNLLNIASTSVNVQQTRNGTGLRIGGARTENTRYVVDGVMVSVPSGGVKESRKRRRGEEAISANNRTPWAQNSNTYNANYTRAKGDNLGVAGGLNDSQSQKRNQSSDESYKTVVENDFKNVKANPLSTISVDVDHASYANVRSYLNGGTLPPSDAVRIEEMVNYFSYKYKQPKGDDPIRMNTELIKCPWNSNNLLLKIGIQAKTISTENLPAANIVFLIDVSGSMEYENKLPLLKEAFKLLTDQLRQQDKVSIVVYAGNSGLALPPTSGANKQAIKDVLDRLTAGGSTAGGEGIQLAYKIAADNFIKGGNNRVVLATDGDFNVGISGDNELEKLIVKEREKGIFLSCLGFGDGNYEDSKMEILADKGNGNYNYIDNLKEAKKTLVKEFGGTIFTVAKDVKTQIEFNPGQVKSYRLIGYENRVLNTEDFKDDKKDAAEMGSGHSVTILYELVPSGSFSADVRPVDQLKYQDVELKNDALLQEELATIKFRYKQPDAKASKELEYIVGQDVTDLETSDEDLKFSSAVALFGMILADSKYKKDGNYNTVLKLAETGKGADKEGYRREFIELVKKATTLKKQG